ncbi:MAG: excinuclease ABC subunit C [Chloroflexi bacterium RBG_16_57_9]|nr:MAG: excinuclease ABC subunit C [Chloroflexi bacterium RBG_16_57_9]
MDRPNLKDKLDNLPTQSGVYLMKDSTGKIIYVGKAVNLRSRVRSYFHASVDSPKTMRLAGQVADIDFIVTESELEALLQEMTLIKRHRPHYNIRLKDDKSYPYIKTTWQDDFPKVFVTRRMQQDGARYFGPYTHVWAVHDTLHTLRKVFPYLTCDRIITGQDKRACLYYDIGLCIAPCIGAASKTEYRAMIDQLCLFLEGKTKAIVDDLQSKMAAAAENLEFERAARFRDQLQAIQRVVERQRVISPELTDQDVIAMARVDGSACVQVFFIRQGKLIGREYFVLEGAEGEDPPELMTSFVKQFYDSAPFVPPEILLQTDIEEAQIISTWLRSKRGGEKVQLHLPRPGTEQDLVQMAAENAAQTLTMLRAQWEADQNKQVVALTELQAALNLEQAPTRIECYDISNIQGTNAVGSMVVFVKGAARKSDYRRFKIRTVEGANDFAMLQEVLRRRFRHALEPQSEPLSPGGQVDPFTLLPDLVIIDGGKGQLNAAIEILEELGLDTVPVVSLAKRQEEIFVQGQSESIRLPRDSQALFLVQRIRDEAHRFAVGYHRTLREKTGMASQLDVIPGIGPRRRQALLKQFGSLEAIREASVDDLASVKGMTRQAAEQLKANL